MDPQKERCPLGSLPLFSRVNWEGIVWEVIGHIDNKVVLRAAQDVPLDKLRAIKEKEALTHEQAQKAPPSGAQNL